MEIVEYSDKSIAIYGETKPWHKKLKLVALIQI